MIIPKPTARRRSDGMAPPVNRKRIKEPQNAVSAHAEKPLEKTCEAPVEETKVLKLLPIKTKGTCPYCGTRIGKGIFGHMKSCQLTAASRIV